MYTLNCNGKLMVINRPVVMGIINITEDSFYSGSRHSTETQILHTAEKMLKDGAAILDIGGQSTRPGSTQISQDEELKRVIPAIATINSHFPGTVISVDTYYSKVAKEAVTAGADIINDISAGSMDEELIPVVAALQVPYILMHMKGMQTNMQHNPQYEDVTTEVLDFFIKQIEKLRQHGIKDIIIDPGFGFGKTAMHNFKLLKELRTFKITDCPVLAGISRKATIYKTLGITAEEALNGTTVLNTIAMMNGADILRVHDVKEAAEAVKLYENYIQSF